MFRLQREEIANLMFEGFTLFPQLTQLFHRLAHLGRQELLELFDVAWESDSHAPGPTTDSLEMFMVVACCIASTKRSLSPRISAVRSGVSVVLSTKRLGYSPVARARSNTSLSLR